MTNCSINLSCRVRARDKTGKRAKTRLYVNVNKNMLWLQVHLIGFGLAMTWSTVTREIDQFPAQEKSVRTFITS